jgi:hypothetical protein
MKNSSSNEEISVVAAPVVESEEQSVEVVKCLYSETFGDLSCTTQYTCGCIYVMEFVGKGIKYTVVTCEDHEAKNPNHLTGIILKSQVI